MNIDLLKVELERDEGKRNKPYRDSVGKLTGGVGRNLDDVGFSDDEISLMLANDINSRVLPGLTQFMPWYVRLNDVQQRVLANMAFNMGIEGLLGFRNMLDAVKSGDFNRAADEMLSSKWASQVGERATRLAEMMRNGA